MDDSLPVSSVHGISQARILERVDTYSSRGSSRPRDQTPVSCTAGAFFTAEPLGKPTVISALGSEFGLSALAKCSLSTCVLSHFMSSSL